MDSKKQPAKGKPIQTSVPSFSFRFNAEDEELEELHTESHQELPELPEEQVNAVGLSESPIRSSTPFNPSTSRDPSPMHSRMVKRSASLEESPGSSNTMRLFNELKGKITKTVEEKINEIKSEKKQKTLDEKRSKLLTSKENSSISDSEECTAPSTGKIDDQTPSLQSTVPSTPETSTPEPEFTLPIDIPIADEKTKIPNLPLDSSTPKKSFFRAAEASYKNKIRPKISELRRRKKSNSNDKTMTLSKLGENNESVEYEVVDEDEIESAVEVQEEPNNLKDGLKSTEKQQSESWSFLGHLSMLLGQRAIQILLAWSSFCLMLPVPSTIRDFVLGALVMHCFYSLFNWLTEPGPPDPIKPLLIPDFSTMPILKVPAAKEYNPMSRFEGWMNELPFEYNPETYHINQTRSVFMRLEGSTLRISLTRQKVRTRAMWNEPPPRRSFYHQRFYDITNCSIKILPDGLARKRLWSKKYPICILLKKDSKVGISVPDDETFKDVIEDQPEDDDMEEENSEDDSTFFKVTNTMVDQDQLILFARTDREKDEWLRRLVAASQYNTSPEIEDSVTPSVESASVPELRISPPSTPEHRPLPPEVELHQHISRFLQQVPKLKPIIDPIREPCKTDGKEARGSFFDLFKKSSGSGSLSSSPKVSPVGSPVKCPLSKTVETPDEEPEELSVLMPPPPADTAWFNAILGRVLFDVLRDQQWSEWVRDRIQRKLSTVKLPTFMMELTVSELDLGVALPVVHRTSAPHMDERGLWVDLDVSYEGSAKICVETKLNLVKLTKADSLESSSGSTKDGPSLSKPEVSPSKTMGKSPIFDSDLEDSAESSSDEDANEVSVDDSSAPGASSSGTSGMGKMLFRMATKITTSKYFQQASEISYIRRAMQEMSNTRVIVIVELKALVGVLAVNIPPPPSDRLWYGFRGNPELRLAAKAKLGERLVTLSQVTDFIENKLCIEFQKVFVLPNMDELIIPVMNGKVPQ